MYSEKSLSLVRDWSALMQMRIPHNLIGPKDIVLLGQNGATLVSEDINDNSSMTRAELGKSHSYWLKYSCRNSFIRPVSDGRNTVQAVQFGKQATLCRLHPQAPFA